MAIVRTPMVDDDGTGEAGTVVNNGWKQELYNQIDGAFAGAQVNAPMVVGPLSLFVPMDTIYNNFAPPDGLAAVVWILSPNGPNLGFTGMLAETDRTQHLLINIQGYPITFYNQHPSSVFANRFIGPGFNDYVLGVWGSVWVIWVQAVSAWVIQKA